MIKKLSAQSLYQNILKNKLITIAILFTIFTLLDTTIILLGYYPPKEGIDAYVHLMGRFFLMSILVIGIYFFDMFSRRLNSRIIAYIANFGITWSFLFLYIKLNGLFTELHPDAVYYMTRSYLGLYLMFGLLLFTVIGVKKLRSRRETA